MRYLKRILMFLLLMVAVPLEADAVSFVMPDDFTDEADNSVRMVLPKDSADIKVTAIEDAGHNTDTTANDTIDKTWWKLLKKGRLNLADTTVVYPKFLKFCVNVYNWADRVFNSYDTAYVVGTGRRWKVRLVSDNWADSYALDLGKKMPVRILSDIYCNAGAYVQYMAVSLGYSFDLSNIIGNKPANHKKLEFGFNCARFNVEMHYWENTGGSYIRKFGKYKDGKFFKEFFPGVSMQIFGLSAYYFFNNRKYSQGAAYNFSKFQKKNAGSFIIGLSYNNLNCHLDFFQLPENLDPYLTVAKENYHLHYRNWSIMTGYGFNWVLNKHLLLNVTAMPEIGITNCYADSYDAKETLFALNFRGRGSLTYNLKDFFVCLIGKIDGHWYKSGAASIFSSVENASLSVGYRF